MENKDVYSKIASTGASVLDADMVSFLTLLESPQGKVVTAALQPIKRFDYMRASILCMMTFLADMGFNVCLTVTGYQQYSEQNQSREQMLENTESAVLFYSQFFTENFPKRIWKRIEFISEVVLRLTSNAERDEYAFEILKLLQNNCNFILSREEKSCSNACKTRGLFRDSVGILREIFYERFWNINPHIVWGRGSHNEMRAYLQSMGAPQQKGIPVQKNAPRQKIVFLNSPEFKNSADDSAAFEAFFCLIQDMLHKKMTASEFFSHINRRCPE